jgi:hypothetical protein
VPIYENISDAKMVKELMPATPPQTTEIDILSVSGVNETGKAGVFYQPKEARVIIELSHRIAWANSDAVAYTVTS